MSVNHPNHHPQKRQRIGLLMQAASARLLGALAWVALLWVAVAWALGETA